MEDEQKGWYHYTDIDGTSNINYCPEYPANHDKNAYGPFKTFSEAKADAVDYFKSDIARAKDNLNNLREFKKPKL